MSGTGLITKPHCHCRNLTGFTKSCMTTPLPIDPVLSLSQRSTNFSLRQGLAWIKAGSTPLMSPACFLPCGAGRSPVAHCLAVPAPWGPSPQQQTQSRPSEHWEIHPTEAAGQMMQKSTRRTWTQCFYLWTHRSSSSGQHGSHLAKSSVLCFS